MALGTDPTALDPFTTSNYAITYGNLLSAIYDPLVWTDPATGTVRPHVADSLTPDASARVWTLTLRPNVVFSDGTPFDAAAVKANWNKHADPSSHSAYALAAAGLKLTVVDPLRLSIELPEPNANFDRIIANGLNYIASPKAIGDLASLAAKPIGAGPFVLAERTPGKSLTLRKNPTYWQPGRPYLDAIDVEVSPPDKDLPSAIAADQTDVGTLTSPALIRQAEDKNLGLINLNLSGGTMLGFNTRKPPFNDPVARHAIADSLSSAEINQRFFQGLGTPAHGIFDTRVPYANAQLAAPENDAARAAAAFNTLTSGGRRPFEFTLLTVRDAPQSLDAVVRYVQQQVERFPAVHMRIETVDTATLIQRTLAGDFTVAVSGLWMNDPEPVLFDFLRPGSPANITGYADPEVTQAMNAARLLTAADARRIQYTRVQVRLNEDLPFWVFQEAANSVVFHPKVVGVVPYNDGVLLFDRIGLRP